ncbi:restriction endonuclease subunit S [Mediterraneibacter faecis]
MAEWKECLLGDLITFQRGHDLPKSKMSGNGYPVVGSNGIIGFHNEYTTEYPSITVGRSGNVGKPYIVYGRSWSHNTSLYIKEFKGTDPIFIYYFLQTLDLGNYAGGSAVPTLNRNHIHSLNVRVPADVSTQEKIANTLKALDDKIDKNTDINKNLEQQAQAIYQQMFIDNASSDWTEGTLSDIADITMGQSPSGNSYNEDGNGTIFFQGRAEFGFRFPTVRLYTTEPKRMAYANDTLMSVRAPVGDLNVAHTDCCIGRGLAAIHSKNNHQSFVLYTMFSLKKQLDVFNGEGTVFGSINRNSLNEMPILIPSSEKLDEFEALVAPMDAAIRNNYDEICRLEQLRDTLLPKLMSGELDFSDIDL